MDVVIFFFVGIFFINGMVFLVFIVISELLKFYYFYYDYFKIFYDNLNLYYVLGKWVLYCIIVNRLYIK